MNLYWVRLGSFLGLRYIKARRQIIIRATLILLGCFTFSTFMYLISTISNFPVFIDKKQTFSIILFIYQILVQLSIWLALRSMGDIVPRLAMTLPINKLRFNFLYILPNIVLLLLIVIGSLPLLLPIGKHFGISPFYSVTGSLLGSLSGWGLAMTFQALLLRVSRLRLLAGFLASISIATEYYMLRYRAANPHTYIYMIIINIAWISCAILRLLIESPQLLSDGRQYVHSSLIPISFWQFKVIWRNRFTRRSFLLAGLIGNGLIGIIAFNHVPLASAFTACVALLAAAACGDIRSLNPPHNPPAIVALQGSFKYSLQLYKTGVISSVMVLLPSLIYIVHLSTASLGSVLCQLFLGATIGCCSGQCIVRAQSTILTSFLVGILGSFSLLVIPSQAWFMVYPVWQQDCFYLWMSLIFIIMGFYVEYKRNSYIWRSQPYV